MPPSWPTIAELESMPPLGSFTIRVSMYESQDMVFGGSMSGVGLGVPLLRRGAGQGGASA
jgi:hypothetical protein